MEELIGHHILRSRFAAVNRDDRMVVSSSRSLQSDLSPPPPFRKPLRHPLEKAVDGVADLLCARAAVKRRSMLGAWDDEELAARALRRQSAGLARHFTREADRGGHLPPLVGALSRRRRRALPQPARGAAHVRDPLASPRRAHGDASKAMGHASIATTVDLYGHVDLSDVARDVALVESFAINQEQSEDL